MNGNFRLDVQNWRKFGSNQKQQHIPLITAVVQQQIAMLKQASIPAFPVSPMVCDGSYIELTIYGESSTLTLEWWTIAPEGAEAVKAFQTGLLQRRSQSRMKRAKFELARATDTSLRVCFSHDPAVHFSAATGPVGRNYGLGHDRLYKILGQSVAKLP